MNKKVCLTLLVCTAAMMTVKSESTIEIDENGDEYEVKRFHIQGRRMNERRSQCVVTRRKRASLPKPLYFNDDLNDEVNDKHDDYAIKDESDQQMLFYTPPLLTHTAAEEEGEAGTDKEEVENNMNSIKKDNKEDDENNDMVKGNTSETEEMKEQEEHDNKEEGDVGAVGVIQLDQLSMSGPVQKNDKPVAASTAGANAVQAATEANSIVVVQSHVPPKVNPQTHAVFAMVPVNYINLEKDTDPEHHQDEFDLKNELTSDGIWSPGGNSLKDFYNDYDSRPLRVQQIKKPNKSNRKQKKNKHSPKPKRKNKYNNNNNNSGGLTTANKRRKKKRRPSKTTVYRPIVTRRRGPNKSNRNRLVAIRNKNKNKKNIVVIDDDKNINCIIIRKDPPSTPAPSFWNLFAHTGRSPPRASGPFGKRKRASMQFFS